MYRPYDLNLINTQSIFFYSTW